MRLILAAATVVLAAGACAPVEAPSSGQGGPQTCDAAGARSVIGSHVGAVDFAPGANVRIVCTTCPTTRDYRPDRLNVWFNQSTGVIERVDCG
jgi:hypothetical protein